ncbi:hypothetical protein IP79_11800 [Porphyrobacter sp. AAP60]|nr:hypothetical protein IP79_11800 [Porphyrobacter sp. AAP60]
MPPDILAQQDYVPVRRAERGGMGGACRSSDPLVIAQDSQRLVNGSGCKSQRFSLHRIERCKGCRNRIDAADAATAFRYARPGAFEQARQAARRQVRARNPAAAGLMQMQRLDFLWPGKALRQCKA